MLTRFFHGPLSDFLRQSLLDVHLLCQHDEPWHLQLLPLATMLSASYTKGSYLLALVSSPLSTTLTAISHSSSSGHYIFRSLHCVVPLVLISHLVDGIHPSCLSSGCLSWVFVLDARMGGVSLSLIR